MERQLKNIIIKDLQKKMVFLVGPRQVGKTWLAQDIGKEFQNVVYLNYDRFEDRQIIQQESWLDSTELLILDEIHKMTEWKNYLKGVYDTKLPQLKILVTGSARLDTFRHSGDSLAGRYFLHHLFPITPQELSALDCNIDLEKLLSRGGFPEPFLTNSDTDADRWRMLYSESMIRVDVLDFEKIQDVRSIQLVFEMLRNRVGSPLSYKSIAEDLNVSPHTIKKYINILESLFIIFRITPFSHNIARSLLKEPKIYFYDTALVADQGGARLENLVALSVLKHCADLRDIKGKNAALHYLRTKDGLEVDFCLTIDNKIEYIAEIKKGDTEPTKSLKHFSNKYNLKAFQIVETLKREQIKERIEIRNAKRFLSAL